MHHTGEIQGVRRLRNSRNGNPTFAITIDEVERRTAADAGFALALTGYETGRRAQVETDKRDQITALHLL